VRTELGERYRSVALTIGWADVPAPVPSPASDLIEHELSQVPSESFLVDLSHADLPAELSTTSGPVRVRAVGPAYDPERDASYSLECPSLPEAFDVVIHQQRSTAATELSPRARA
jgi:erythromycin esterase